jgi:hypothetical protein
MPNFAADTATSDFMSRSTILRKFSPRREEFVPTNQEHLDSLAAYIKTGSWGSVMFYPEHPYTDVITTVLYKHAMHVLGVTERFGYPQPKVANEVNP